MSPNTGKHGSPGREKRSESGEGSHFHFRSNLSMSIFHCDLTGGDAKRLQDSGRHPDEPNKECEDDNIAHHCLIGFLSFLIRVHLIWILFILCKATYYKITYT